MWIQEILTTKNLVIGGGILALIGTAVGLWFTIKSTDRNNSNRNTDRLIANRIYSGTGDLLKWIEGIESHRVISQGNASIDGERPILAGRNPA